MEKKMYFLVHNHISFESKLFKDFRKALENVGEHCDLYRQSRYSQYADYWMETVINGDGDGYLSVVAEYENEMGGLSFVYLTHKGDMYSIYRYMKNVKFYRYDGNDFFENENWLDNLGDEIFLKDDFDEAIADFCEDMNIDIKDVDDVSVAVVNDWAREKGNEILFLVDGFKGSIDDLFEKYWD